MTTSQKSSVLNFEVSNIKKKSMMFRFDNFHSPFKASLAVLIWRTVRSQGEHTCEVLGPCCAWHRSWGVGILPRKWMNKYRFHTSERPSCPQEGLAPELCGEPGTIATALTCTAQVLPGRCSHPSWRLSVVMVMEAHAVLGCQSPGPVLGRQACVVCVRMCTSV